MQFFGIVAFLILVAFTGGSSRTDVESVVLLYPAAMIGCGMALVTLKRRHVEGRALLIVGIAAILSLCLLHLLPMPITIGAQQPLRTAIQIIYNLEIESNAFAAFSVAPLQSVYSLIHLALPLVILLWGFQLNRRDLNRLLPIVIGLGALSGILGLLQIIGGAEGPLYLYNITNRGNAVGLFANRNHGALLLACLFPILAVWASIDERRQPSRYSRKMMALALSILVFPLLLVTGSRSGILIGLLGLVASLILFQTANSGNLGKGTSKYWYGLGMLSAICLIFLTIFYSRAEALDRLLGTTQAEDMRLEYWHFASGLFWQYLPLGAGSGAFADIYRVVEPNRLLNSNFVNHAHNDWIETAVLFGFPGIALVFIALIFFVRRSFSIWIGKLHNRYSTNVARMAGLTIILIGVASLTDYPLRTPLFSCLFAIMLLWFIGPNSASHEGEDT